MSDIKDNGGPAFPTEAEFFSGGDMKTPAWHGMTLRDYFAAKAMLGFISEPVEGVRDSLVYQVDDGTCIAFARSAYMIADAMLKERAK